ncbi:MAG TPA: phosphate ABC transporter substrate-binding protein PstS [Tepidisphaeraceae bacterium]|jgi:phosphate transport system substrate-binding protein|nr:phosphate ABC transporter substrate-binding protein PstS [Tepidisphaeraceae bacterium]
MKTFASVLAGFGMLALGVTTQAADLRLQGGGATFPAPVYQRWVTEYQKLHPDVQIDYQAIGSGGGIKGITEKTFDFAGSDAPMSKKEIAKAGGREVLVEIPTVAGAVVVAYNLKGFQGELKLDGPTLAEIYLGNIKKWNDPKIAALNAGATLPNLPITTVHRTDGSGTNFIFTNYLGTQSEEFNKKVGSGKSVEWPNGEGGAFNSGVTQIVQQTNGAIGYIELAYALQNKIPFAVMKNKDGKFVKATAETVSLAGEGAVGNLKGNLLAANIWDQPGEKAYPISSFTYIIVYKDLAYVKDPAKAKALAEFLRWATTDGEKMAASLDYAPLSPGVQKKVEEALASLTLGGKPVGK